MVKKSEPKVTKDTEKPATSDKAKGKDQVEVVVEKPKSKAKVAKKVSKSGKKAKK